MSWELFTCIASFVIACILGVILYRNWRVPEDPYEQPFGDCPWPIVERERRTILHSIEGHTR